MVLITLQIDEAVANGDVSKVKSLLNASDFAREYAAREGGHQGYYAVFKAKLVAAQCEADLRALYRKAEEDGRHHRKLYGQRAAGREGAAGGRGVRS